MELCGRKKVGRCGLWARWEDQQCFERCAGAAEKQALSNEQGATMEALLLLAVEKHG